MVKDKINIPVIMIYKLFVMWYFFDAILLDISQDQNSIPNRSSLWSGVNIPNIYVQLFMAVSSPSLSLY